MMPKLKDISVNAFANGKFDITFHAQYPCKVLSDGVFYAELPDNALHEFKMMFNADTQRAIAHEDRVKLYRDKKGATHLTAHTLGRLTKALNDHGQMKVSTTRDVERVIFFWQGSTAFYWMTNNGLIEPNGENHVGADGKWVGDRSLASFGPKGFGNFITATIADRVVSTTADGQTSLHYERPENDSLGPEGQRLHRFNQRPWPTEPHRRDHEDEQPYVPYTEKAAAFFADLMQKTCEEADRRARFFEDLEGAISDIERGAKL